jgi:hypothetical protein
VNLLSQSNALSEFACQTPTHIKQGLFLLGLLLFGLLFALADRNRADYHSGAYDQAIGQEISE